MAFEGYAPWMSLEINHREGTDSRCLACERSCGSVKKGPDLDSEEKVARS
jgi:hypothetical protein